MTIEEEQEWQEQTTYGRVLTVPPIHAALIERLGHAIPLSTTYRLMARHGWWKVQPDTKHPKSDPAAQDEFKKTSEAVAAACLKNETRLPVRHIFQDEARFGRNKRPSILLCPYPTPHRPVVGLVLIREFRYEYAAVSPWYGCLDFMTPEKINTENMTLFLNQVSEAHKKNFIELDPTKQLWNVLRWTYFAYRVFEALDAATTQAELGLTEMAANKQASNQKFNHLALD